MYKDNQLDFLPMGRNILKCTHECKPVISMIKLYLLFFCFNGIILFLLSILPADS